MNATVLEQLLVILIVYFGKKLYSWYSWRRERKLLLQRIAKLSLRWKSLYLLQKTKKFRNILPSSAAVVFSIGKNIDYLSNKDLKNFCSLMEEKEMMCLNNIEQLLWEK